MSSVTQPAVRAMRGLSSNPLLSRSTYRLAQLRSTNDEVNSSIKFHSRRQLNNFQPDLITGNDKIIRQFSTSTRPSTDSPDFITGNDKIVRAYSTQTRPSTDDGPDLLTGNDKIIRSRYYSTHRPSPTTVRFTPLMQGFSTTTITAPSNTPISSPSIDNWIFPAAPAEPPLNPFEKLRVPLLPDNYAPNRAPGSAHELDTPDAVFMKEERVIAAYPEDVSTMTEVVGDMSKEISLGELTKMVREKISKVEVKEATALRTLWNDVLEDLSGKKSPAFA